jgi:hypothetical protein
VDGLPRLADVFPDLVSDIAQALSVEGPDSFVETFTDLLFHGPCPDPRWWCVLGRCPFRTPVLASVRSCGAAPITEVSSASIRAW